MASDAADAEILDDLRRRLAEEDPVPPAVLADAYRAWLQAGPGGEPPDAADGDTTVEGAPGPHARRPPE